MENVGYSGLSGNLSGLSYTYIYDALGNIATMTPSTGNAESYTYDAMGQLTGAAIGETSYAYTYDGTGNILTAQEGDVTNTYTYGNENWKDLLTAYNDQPIMYEGQTITDGVVSGTPTSGNPIRYNNGTQWGFSWSEGRNLKVATKSSTSLTFQYDASGLRTQKNSANSGSGRNSTYLYAGGKLLRETRAVSVYHGPSSSAILDFTYDASGSPYSLIYNNGRTTATYYYITNLQGDVMYLVDETGAEVAAYTYDPYGKVLSATGTMAAVNPLRYRGYYQDSETGFYYLQSRYYDPEIGRFINADSYASTGQGYLGYNMFAYCNNNPICASDPSGNFGFWAKVALGTVVGAVVGAISAAVTGGNATDILINTVAGATAGLCISFFGNEMGTRVAASAITGIGTYYDCWKNGLSVGESLFCAGVSAATTYAAATLSGMCGDDIVASTLVDSTFGLEAGLASAGVSAGFTKANENKTVEVVPNSSPRPIVKKPRRWHTTSVSTVGASGRFQNLVCRL